MRSEIKTYRYVCDNPECGHVDFATGERLPAGWTETKRAASLSLYNTVHILHTCNLCNRASQNQAS